MIGGQRHRHRVDAVFQHLQLAEHKAFYPAIQLAAADTVDGVDHIADRAGDVAHQAVGKQNGNTHTQQQQQGRNEHLFILLQAYRLQIQLDRHIAEIAIGMCLLAGAFVRELRLRQDWRAQDQ
ncbi:hypothetical protein D3C72_1736540 [compost metagenome]